jgi:RecA/RadA recombinase
MYTVSPNTEIIKSLIDKYESGRISMIYGNSASGKTTCCLLASFVAEKYKVIYVDTESTFSPERLKQLYSKDIKSILENIFLIQPKTFKEQHDTIMKLKEICNNEKIKLVIVDTIGHHYRNMKSENLTTTNNMMIEQMATLVRVARDLDKVVLLTNQVVADVSGNNDFRMIGGKPVYNLCKNIIELNRDASTQKRTAKLIKKKMDSEKTTYYNLGKEIKFEIKEKGLFLCD